MSLPCGCPPQWLTEVSEPIDAVLAVANTCPCCWAPPGERCKGGLAGFVDGPKGAGKFRPDARAYVDVCPSRLNAHRQEAIAA